jgi:hypothetical protein
MRTIKFTEQMTYKETEDWCYENKNNLIFEKEKIIIDFSGICMIYSNMLGFIINLITTRKKNNLETEIIPTQGSFHAKDFRVILGGKK